jgi:catechol 2,3-dioxygenase-like lactoylglutathione lyase family enzyme
VSAAPRYASTMRVLGLDHVVLTVRDVGRTVDFYTRVLGMSHVTFGAARHALHFGRQKLNLHPADRVLDPNVRHALPGSADLCLIVADPLEEVIAALGRHGVPIILGPVERTGATGPIRSVYVYDPDENLIELANETAAAR